MKNTKLKKAIILFSCVTFSACSSQTPATTSVEKLDSKTMITNQINDLVNKGKISKDEHVSVIRVGDANTDFLAKISFKEGFKTKANVNGTVQSVATDITSLDVYLIELDPNTPTSDPLNDGNVIISKANISKSTTDGTLNVLFTGLPKNNPGKQYYVGVVAKDEGNRIINKPPTTAWTGTTLSNEPSLILTSSGVGVSEQPVNGINILQVSTTTDLTISLNLLDAIGAVVSTNVSVNNGIQPSASPTISLTLTPELAIIAGNATGAGGFSPSLTPHPATAVDLNTPAGVAVDNTGNVYITDFNNSYIEKVDTNGSLTVIAGKSGGVPPTTDLQAATDVQLSNPTGISLDNNGNTYIVDYSAKYIEKIDSLGMIKIIAGAGASGSPSATPVDANSIKLDTPNQVLADNNGNIYIVEFGTNRIEKIDTTTNMITVIAGGGASTPTTAAQAATDVNLNGPNQLARDNSGNIYIADGGNNYIEKLDSTGMLSVIAGKPGGSVPATTNQLATNVALSSPYGLTVDNNSGNIYLSNRGNGYIEKIDSSGNLKIVGGRTGGLAPKTNEQIATNIQISPTRLTTDSSGNLYVVDGDNNTNFIEKITGLMELT